MPRRGREVRQGTVPWAIKGELILNCNCTVFCPCVISLGDHPPTEGTCMGWAGIRIDEGHYGDADLSGLNVGLLLEIPGRWRAATGRRRPISTSAPVMTPITRWWTS